MATAFFLPLANLFAPLQALADWFASRPQPGQSAPARTPAPRQPSRPPETRRLPGKGPVTVPQQAKPLRVVRYVEPQAPRAMAGRMVISGRLADVCAELDRLAAQEARAGGHGQAARQDARPDARNDARRA